MTKLLLAATAALLALDGAAEAQAPPAAGAPPPPMPRARGPSLALAVEAAQTAIATCAANGYKVTALVVDADTVPVALLSSDGAPARTTRWRRARPMRR